MAVDLYDHLLSCFRCDHVKPMDLASYIQRQLDQKQSKQQIATMLGVGSSQITYHLALLNSPNVILEVFGSGKTTSPRTIYELYRLYKRFPVEVERWCKDAEIVNRRTVASLERRLKRGPD